MVYVRRLWTTLPGENYTAIYIAATGLDHRLGWVAFRGMVSIFITLLRHVINVDWSSNPNLHLPRRSTFDWKMEILLEIVAAAIGQSTRSMLMRRISTSTLITVHNFGLRNWKLRDNYSTLLVLLCIQYRVPLMAGMQRRSSGIRRILLGTFMIGSALYIATVAFL